MLDLNRSETTHVDEVSRTATSTLQWLVEKPGGDVEHPITHNNKLTVFMCAEESFGDIAEHIAKATHSIDLICWGFDPGMELVRGNQGTWPRGPTYGDLLIEAGNRGVRVRLLLWFDPFAASTAQNAPGLSHGTSPWRNTSGATEAEQIGAQHSVRMLREHLMSHGHRTGVMMSRSLDAIPIEDKDIPFKAREEYCHSWYSAASHGLIPVDIRTRKGSRSDIIALLASEEDPPRGLLQLEAEAVGMKALGTHHQKSILIDFIPEQGKHAVGYVMGLNSVTDYWDTNLHLVDDARREQGGKRERDERTQGIAGDQGFCTVKPLHDYICRLEGGRALIPMYTNFVRAWDRAVNDRMNQAALACVNDDYDGDCKLAPAVLSKMREPGDSTVQIVRTQPEEHDKSIRDAYFLATQTAANGSGYMYIENQYFQYETWAKHLMECREKTIARWRLGCAKAGKGMEDMPLMHLFIVIPVPERAQMIPRTYDILATLGQQDAMTGQCTMLKKANERASHQTYYLAPDLISPPPIDDITQHANSISKPDVMTLEKRFGLKISVAMLNTSAFIGNRWCYREIYIHSKLMLCDDVFMTLGSANMNQRSMSVDSEINLATIAPVLTKKLRRRIWGKHSGGLVDGGDGSKTAIVSAFRAWTELMSKNRIKKIEQANSSEVKKMNGFLLPLEDDRNSNMRLG